MLRRILLGTLLAAAAAGPRPAAAQNAGPEPSAVAMLSSADDVYAAIDVVMSLTGAVDQKQTKVIKGYLDVFLIGMDKGRPIEMDLRVDDQPYRYRSGFPVPESQMNTFRNKNLGPLGIQSRRVAQTLYSLGGKVFNGWMRFDDGGTPKNGADDYAWISSEKNDFGAAPGFMPNPVQTLDPLLKQGYVGAGEVRNANNNAQARWQLIRKPGGMHAQGLERIKPRENEDPADFKLRKMLSEHRLEEMEQYIAEAEHAVVGGRLNPAVKEATLDLDLTPLPGTGLADTIGAIGQTPSRFAAIPQSENPVTTARINYPLDQLRKDNLTETVDVILERRAAKIDASTERDADQKDAAREATDILFGVLRDTVQGGRVDLFAEIWPGQDGTHTMLVGLGTVNGDKLVDALKLLPDAHDGQTVEIGVDTVGDVTIHSVLLLEQDNPEFGNFFGTYTAYVGTSKDSAWFAIGANALDELKRSVELAGASDQPEGGEPVFVAIDTRIGPLMDLARDPKAGEQPGQFSKYRDIAQTSFQQGDDRLRVRMEKTEDGGGVTGGATATGGILRFIGRAAAEFSRDNLDDQGKPKRDQQAGAPRRAN